MDARRCGLPRRPRIGPRWRSAAALSLVALLGGSRDAGANPTGYRYLSPSPGSRYVSPWNNIAVRHGSILDARAVSGAAISVRGSQSGAHPGRLVLSDNARTLVFVPSEPFSPGEAVSVRFEGGPTAVPGESMPPLEFGFSVSRSDGKQSPGLGVEWPFQDPLAALRSSASAPASPARSTTLTSQPCDTLPFKYIPVTVMMSDNPDPGHVFITPLDIAPSASAWGLLILDNLGNPIFFRRTPVSALGLEMQPNGLLTYFSGAAYWMLDSAYAVVDSFRTGNGYTTDGHELRLLPNGHALLMAYDPQPVDMSLVVAGGNPNAIVIGLIIQELDAAKNVVFQWRSWDHFQITDMIETATQHFTDARIDYAHGNAIEPDADGNLLISSRHMSEITKIDRQTGAIIWRLGLNAKNNEFTFVNDTRGFSHQHDIRRLPNGHITLYDNGNDLVPQYSRGLEYALDEQNKTATQTWEYRDTPDVYGFATGNTQRLPSGGTIIGWGITGPDPKVTEVHADGSKALELGFNSATIFTYRALRYPWKTNLFTTDASALDFGTVRMGEVSTLPLSIHNNATSALELTCFATTNSDFYVADAVPLVVPAGGDATVNVRFVPTAGGPLTGRLYVKSVHGSELVAQVVTVTGIGDSGGVGGDPSSGPWLTVFPSPGRGPRALVFAMPVTGQARLQIYDLRGRLIATPFEGIAEAGLHEVAWNGRTDADERVHSGLYFARFTTGAGTRIEKFVNLD